MGFPGEAERTVLEGSAIEICADLVEFPILYYLRFDDRFPVSTSDGSAQGKEKIKLHVECMYQSLVYFFLCCNYYVIYCCYLHFCSW